ncbi:MAG: LytTR family DNA-binding domain-containing protein, partial [Bacteroidota bacterium]
DALILDIQMPDLTGLELLDTLREKAPKTIFTTAHTDFALQGFEYDQVVDYLHKPVRLTRFIKAMERLKGQLELEKLSKKPLSATDGLVSSQNGQYVLVKQNKTTFKVALDDIQYMQSWGNYLKIFTRDGKMKIARKTISEMEKELLYHGFYRIHNSYLVNSKAVNGIVGNHVMLSKQRLPIGRAYKINTMKQLFE